MEISQYIEYVVNTISWTYVNKGSLTSNYCLYCFLFWRGEVAFSNWQDFHHRFHDIFFQCALESNGCQIKRSCISFWLILCWWMVIQLPFTIYYVRASILKQRSSILAWTMVPFSDEDLMLVWRHGKQTPTVTAN